MKQQTNGEIRIGVKKTSGGAIGYLSPAQSSHNLLNHFDHGRLIQQSYYGDRDGSTWAGKPWRWNPVQGGDWRGHASTLLELKAEPASIYTKTFPSIGLAALICRKSSWSSGSA